MFLNFPIIVIVIFLLCYLSRFGACFELDENSEEIKNDEKSEINFSTFNEFSETDSVEESGQTIKRFSNISIICQS